MYIAGGGWVETVKKAFEIPIMCRRKSKVMKNIIYHLCTL